MEWRVVSQATDASDSGFVTAVTEPASLVLAGTGLGAAAAHQRKRRSQASQA
jgi:hypothetical protein